MKLVDHICWSVSVNRPKYRFIPGFIYWVCIIVSRIVIRIHYFERRSPVFRVKFGIKSDTEGTWNQRCYITFLQGKVEVLTW